MVSWNPTGSFATGSFPPDPINGIFWEETPDLPISPLGNPIVPTEVECCLSEEYEITKIHQLEMAPFNKKVIVINLKLLNKETIEKINNLIDTSTKLVDLILKLQIPNVFTGSISPLLHNRNIKNLLTTLEITSESALSNLELENLAQFLHSNRSLKTLQLEEINTRHCEKKLLIN
jgi:hypothetical protein